MFAVVVFSYVFVSDWRNEYKIPNRTYISIFNCRYSVFSAFLIPLSVSVSVFQKSNMGSVVSVY